MEKDLTNISWNDFQNSTINIFKNIQEDETFMDITLACEDGMQIKAHKVILGAISAFFKNILVQNPHQHPIIYLKGVNIENLKALVNFIYCGEVQIANESLETFLETANDLQIEGLYQKETKKKQDENLIERSIDKSRSPTRSTRISTNEGFKPYKRETLETKVEIKLDLQTNENVPKEESFDVDNESIDTHKQFECEFCPDAFEFETALNVHVQSHVNIIRPSNRHKPMICEICLKIFTTNYSMQEHKEAIHDKIRYSCDYCDSTSSSKRNLRMHINKKHPDMNYPTTFRKPNRLRKPNSDTQFMRSIIKRA